MTRTVLKTAIITLVSVIIALAIVFLCLFLFTPKTLGDFFDGAGNYSAAVYFYEKQYDKSGDIEDLSVLIEKLDVHDDCTRSEKYLNIFVKDKGFSDYCKANNAKKNKNIKTEEFAYGKLAVATYLSKGASSAIETCKSAVSVTGYCENSAFRFLITDLSLKFTDNELNSIKSAITEMRSGLGTTEQTIADQDVALITQRLG